MGMVRQFSCHQVGQRNLQDHRGLMCIRKERHRVFLGAHGEVADLPFRVNIVAMVKMSLISPEGMSNVVHLDPILVPPLNRTAFFCWVGQPSQHLPLG